MNELDQTAPFIGRVLKPRLKSLALAPLFARSSLTFLLIRIISSPSVARRKHALAAA